jgi:AcrR family transcriptional regulator
MKRLPTEERRRQIADAALHIIAEHGLRRFTVAAIAEEVGLTDGSIFRHFDDKDEIIVEAVRRLEQALRGPDAPLPTADTALERLGMFLRRRIELMQRRPEILKLLFSDDLAKAGPEEAKARIRAIKLQSMVAVRAHLQAAIDEGSIRQDCSADELLHLIHGMALAVVFSGPDLAAVTKQAATPDEVWSLIARLLRAPGA